MHVYAVDVGERSFPMEFYWTFSGNKEEAWLVNPSIDQDLYGRHEPYMQKHGVTYEDLSNFGKTPDVLCALLNDSFRDSEVLVSDDELEFTDFLLTEFYAFAKMERNNFVLSPLSKFFGENEISDQDMANLKSEFHERGVGGAMKFCYLKDLVRSVLDKRMSVS
jgi:hypothetical protein